jgi:NAD(P)-dependent dehydrogenase (short-subunit alcohol dehydrogenase family)
VSASGRARFTGKVALVTGAASGMGRAIAHAFAEEGASVVAADVNQSGGDETVALISAAGGTATFVRTDVSQAADVAAMVARAVDGYGRLDAAVNAAAIENETATIVDADEANFDRVLAINVKGVFLCMREEIRAMLALGNGGAVVNFGSTNSYRPQPQQTAYTASKHAVIGLTKSAAIEVAGQGVRVNAICPGAIDTPMLRGAMERRGRDPQDVANRLSLLGRFGVVEEIAQAALWLCSDESTFTVGHALAVDGGYLAR